MNESACLSATFWLYFFGFRLASFHDKPIKNQYQIKHKEEMRIKIEPIWGNLSKQ
jgi:hypothetical protein